MFIHIFNCLNEIIFENFSIRMTEQNAQKFWMVKMTIIYLDQLLLLTCLTQKYRYPLLKAGREVIPGPVASAVQAPVVLPLYRTRTPTEARIIKGDIRTRPCGPSQFRKETWSNTFNSQAEIFPLQRVICMALVGITHQGLTTLRCRIPLLQVLLSRGIIH